MENDPLIDTLPSEVEPYYGNLTEKDSMRDFFAAGGENFCVLHCAGIVSIASNPGKMLYSVNVQGTQNIIDLCREYHAAKLVYVSSVHAIPEKPAPQTITETHQFTPDEIDGDYGKSKAMATALVLKAAQEGLNASVVHPSGIIGPGDLACGNLRRTRKSRRMLHSFRSLRKHPRHLYDDCVTARREGAEALRACRAGEMLRAHL